MANITPSCGISAWVAAASFGCGAKASGSLVAEGLIGGGAAPASGRTAATGGTASGGSFGSFFDEQAAISSKQRTRRFTAATYHDAPSQYAYYR